MKIVVVGDGKVGYTLTKQLSQEGHEVVVIDNDPRVLRESQEILDVAIVDGNGALVEVQRSAGVHGSDLLIAATSSDEVNLLCCLVARKLGCRNTIARVRDPEYDQQISFLKSELGLSLAVNPEKAAALEIFRILQFPSFLKRDTFAKGRVELVEIRIKQDSVLAGRRLDELDKIWKINALICVVERNGEITIPRGSFKIEAGDKITVASDAAQLAELIDFLKISTQKVRRVMLVGGSRIAAYLADLLWKSKVEVTIIEENQSRCETLSQILPNALIIHGNGTLQNLLLAEGIRDMDAVVTLTGIDEENLIISMFANYVGVPKTITKINRFEYTAVFANMGIDTIISPKLLTADVIIRYVRAIGRTGEDSVETLYSIADGKAEALEFLVPDDGSYLNLPLSKLKLKPDILIACITRANRVIIPKGGDTMLPGDSVVVVTAADRKISRLSDIFLTGIAE